MHLHVVIVRERCLDLFKQPSVVLPTLHSRFVHRNKDNMRVMSASNMLHKVCDGLDDFSHRLACPLDIPRTGELIRNPAAGEVKPEPQIDADDWLWISPLISHPNMR